jgi:hypothetical protein
MLVPQGQPTVCFSLLQLTVMWIHDYSQVPQGRHFVVFLFCPCGTKHRKYSASKKNEPCRDGARTVSTF